MKFEFLKFFKSKKKIFDEKASSEKEMVLIVMTYILIHTDGYDIDYDDSHKKLDAAKRKMEQQYKDYTPPCGLSPEWADLSYIHENNAILYANGENVHVWKIIAVEG